MFDAARYGNDRSLADYINVVKMMNPEVKTQLAKHFIANIEGFKSAHDKRPSGVTSQELLNLYQVMKQLHAQLLTDNPKSPLVTDLAKRLELISPSVSKLPPVVSPRQDYLLSPGRKE